MFLSAPDRRHLVVRTFPVSQVMPAGALSRTELELVSSRKFSLSGRLPVCPSVSKQSPAA